jgi:hypothetical protein
MRNAYVDRLALGILSLAVACTLPLLVHAQSFVNVAPELGLTHVGNSGGVFWYDYDNDGDQDLLHSYRFWEPDVIYRNDGEQFTALTDIGLGTDTDAGKSIPMDFDHDGDLDIWLNQYGTVCQLMVNENGTFVDRRQELGIPPINAGREFTWVDLNQDGWMDILFTDLWNWYFFRNDEGTHFTDVSSSLQLPSQNDISSFSEADIDLDGDIDLYMTQIGGPNHLYVNQGMGSFVDRTVDAGLNGIPADIGSAWVDINHDKYPDLLTQETNYHGLWLNNTDGTFTEMIVHGTGVDDWGGFPFGANYAVADYDRDGDEDFYVCRPGGWGEGSASNQFFRQDSLHGTEIWFTEVGAALGMDFMPDGMASWIDYDGDNDLDLYISLHGMADRLYRNDTPGLLSGFQVQVLGPQGDRDRWHTRVEIYPHGNDEVIAASELNYSNVNRNGLNNYFAVDPQGHYDLRIYFADGTSMLPQQYPGLADIVPSDVNYLVTVYKAQGVDATPPVPAPIDFGLQSAYPNPFNATTTIEYQVPQAGDVKLSVYAIDGRWVTDLVNGATTVGAHRATWNAGNAASGVYVVRLAAAQQVAMQKVVLLK